MIKNFWQDDRGEAKIEYALVAIGILLALITIVNGFDSGSSTLLTRTNAPSQ
jgi:Flp pilus assembly pilin Flp